MQKDCCLGQKWALNLLAKEMPDNTAKSLKIQGKIIATAHLVGMIESMPESVSLNKPKTLFFF